MVEILNSAFERVAVIKKIIDSYRFEELNGENNLEFTAVLTDKATTHIDENHMVKYNDDYFDIVYYSKEMKEDGKFIIKVESEHISYRLNDAAYDLEYFTYTGSPALVLTQLLSGTGFAAGSMEFNDPVTYSAQEKKSRRTALLEFVSMLGGELLFNQFSVSILIKRGSTDVKILTKNKNVRILSKVYNGRENPPVVAYDCTPILLPGEEMSLGDSVLLVQPELGISETLRVVRLGYNPMDKRDAQIQIGNKIDSLEDQMYRIETNALQKGKTYYGARISAENGFESIRSDKKARGIFNADIFALQTGDGTGSSWTDQLYFDPVTGTYIFNGALTAQTIEAIKADLDIVVSNAVITQALAAGSGTIAELTVDSLDTSSKVAKYLSNSTADVNYIKIYEQNIEFITASTDGSDSEPVYNRLGDQLYWSDETHMIATASETEYPVMQFTYTEMVKMAFSFELDSESGYYLPTMVFGAGDQNGYSKGYIYKGQTGLYIKYVASDSTERIIQLTDEGIDLTDFEAIKYAETVVITGLPQIWVQQGVPIAAKAKDVWIDTDDYSRYDKTELTSGTTLLLADDEVILANGTFTITLHLGTPAGIIKKIYNKGTGLVTIAGTINGVANMLLYPNESVELITDGTAWRC